MRILYDHQIFSSQVYGGISRYFCELMNRFSICGEDFELSLRYSNNHYLKNSSFSKHKMFFEQYHFRGKNKLPNFINKQNSIKRLKLGEYDVFHPTYYDPYFLEYIGSKPFALTIHDMIHEKFPKMFPTNDKTSEWKKLLASRAAKIIAISENTKQDIIKFYGIEEQKIEVIYHGNTLRVNKYINLPSGLPEQYLLYIGDRHIYKNFKSFIPSVSQLLDENKNLNVVCGGGKKFDSDEEELFKELGIRERIHHFQISDDAMLVCLYKNAVAFVFPSLYEGFGLPILEAFSCGCPVILSNTSSVPEIAGDAAAYFNPYEVGSMNEQIRKVIYDEELREELKEKGSERLKSFSWEKTAKQTKEVYDRCV